MHTESAFFVSILIFTPLEYFWSCNISLKILFIYLFITVKTPQLYSCCLLSGKNRDLPCFWIIHMEIVAWLRNLCTCLYSEMYLNHQGSIWNIVSWLVLLRLDFNEPTPNFQNFNFYFIFSHVCNSFLVSPT